MLKSAQIGTESEQFGDFGSGILDAAKAQAANIKRADTAALTQGNNPLAALTSAAAEGEKAAAGTINQANQSEDGGNGARIKNIQKQ